MKRLSLKEIFAFSIFLLVVVSATLIVRPMYKLVSVELNKVVQKACQTVEKNTGLSVSYEKLSPSILTGLNVKNITLKDSATEKIVAKIKKTVVRYSISEFLKGNGINSVKYFGIDGFSLEVDSENAFVKKLIENNQEKDSEKKSQEEEKSGRIVKNIQNLTSLLPFDVYIRNVHLIFRKNENVADVNFKKAVLTYLKNSKALQVKTSGGTFIRLKNQKISFGFAASGSVTEDFEGSLLSMSVSDFSNGNLSLNRLNLALSYRNRTFDIKTIKNGYPLFVQALYNLDSTETSFFVKTQDLKPADTLSLRKSSELYKKIRALSLSIEASANYNFLSENFNYRSSGVVNVPDSLYKDGFSGSYSFYGNTKNLSVDSIKLSGKNIDIDYSGSCVFENLKLSGNLMVNTFLLKNGGIISTEVYFDPLKSGFMAFAPQLMLNEKSLTALELSVIPVQDSFDFTFELSDYSHLEAENAGSIKINGSYIGGTNYVQANVSSNGIYLDSAAQTAAFFAKKQSSSDFNFLSNYIFNGELFVSTDLSQISYNVPYAFVVNTKKENQFVYLSLDGNGSSLNLNRLDFINGEKLSRLSGLYEKSPDGKDAFVIADLNIDSIPYHFTGSIMPELVSLNGDYGIAFDLRKKNGNGFAGNFSAEGLPVSLAESIFTISADTEFDFSEDDGINVKISKIETREASDKISFSPVLNLTGNVSKYGVFLDSISYSDKFSALDGSMEFLWNINDSLFDSANLKILLKNPLSSEEIAVSASVSNPNGEKFSAENLKKSFYLNSQVSLKNFGLNRFLAEQSENNVLTATLIASGIPENPYVGLGIEELSLMTAGKAVNAKASAFIEDKIISVENSSVVYNNINIKDILADFDLKTFTGSASATLDTIIAKQTLCAPLTFTISDSVIEEGKSFPSEFAARLFSENISGTLIKKAFPFDFRVLYANGTTTVYSAEEQGISGNIKNDGSIEFSVTPGKPVQFSLSGNVKGKELDVSMKKFSADLGKLFEYVDIPRIKVYNGNLRGSAKVSGLKSDPEFLGSFVLSSADFTLPKIVSQHVTIPKAVLLLDHSELRIPETRGYVKKDIPVNASMSVYFDRWSFSRLDARIWNPKNVYMPGDFEIRLAHFIGNVNLDLNLSFEDRYLDVAGDVFLKKVTGSVKTKELALPAPKRNWFARSDIKIHFGQHVTFVFDPLLRAVLVPNTELGFKYDMSEGEVELDGELAFRSGDISYLSRNFYLKNGSMRFNSNDPTFNPLISVQAETREHDDNGNDVRIILTASNQYLLDFNAQFSSIPAKSESEIRSLLGQIAVGDSERVSSLLFATGDYAIQSTIGRSIENKLRDFLNFDILSVRTNVLQNALNYGLLKRSEDSENTSVGFGNFFDNSTVYIGKYFGSSLYMDALMHWSYDEMRIDDTLTPGGLVFRPEFGLEIEAPFGNIRWNMAPDINGIRNDKFVSSTSVTLSWKFSF